MRQASCGHKFSRGRIQEVSDLVEQGSRTPKSSFCVLSQLLAVGCQLHSVWLGLFVFGRPAWVRCFLRGPLRSGLCALCVKSLSFLLAISCRLSASFPIPS